MNDTQRIEQLETMLSNAKDEIQMLKDRRPVINDAEALAKAKEFVSRNPSESDLIYFVASAFLLDAKEEESQLLHVNG